MFYIISYDIPDDKKRNGVAKTLLDFGKRVQYSVFECIMDDAALENLLKRLGEIIAGDDSVRIYELCAKCEKSIRVLGAGKITEDESVYIL